MTYHIEVYKAVDFHKIFPQDVQQEDLFHLAETDWTPESMEGQPHSFSWFRDDLLLGVSSVSLIWPGRAQVNLLLSENVHRIDMLFLTRQLRSYLDVLQADRNYQRCECSVLEEFKQGHRWIKMLGFTSEGLMRSYDVSGRDHRLYARIKL